MPGGGGYYWPPGMMYGPPMPGVTALLAPARRRPATAPVQPTTSAKNWRARLRLLLEAGNEASPPLLSEVLDEIATAAGEGRCRPGARAVLRVYGDDDGEDDFATRAALQPRSIAESVLAAATREPQPLTDGPDRKTSAAPQSRLNAPIPIAHVIDGSRAPARFPAPAAAVPRIRLRLNADGTLGASTRVQILFDTGAMGEVGEKRHMPPGTRYTGVKVLRAFLHHATITAEIAHVVLRFGDVYVSRAVYVVPDGSWAPMPTCSWASARS
eukprot:tig00021622_g22992.t1